MTVEELIALLSEYDPSAPVLVEGYETGFDGIHEVTQKPVFAFRKAQEYDGQFQSPSHFEGDGGETHPAVVILGYRGQRRGQTPKARYTLADLMEDCDPSAPMPQEVTDWDRSPEVGNEMSVLLNQSDAVQAALKFGTACLRKFPVTELVLFGARARGHYAADDEIELAVILNASEGGFLETKLKMSEIAFDTLLSHKLRIRPYPIWQAQWQWAADGQEGREIQDIAEEGVSLWRDEL